MIGARLRIDDAQTRLVRTLERVAAAAEVALVVAECRARPWASATFEGVELAFALTASPGAAAQAWVATLPDAELPVRGYVAMPPAIDAVTPAGDGVRIVMTVLVLIDG